MEEYNREMDAKEEEERRQEEEIKARMAAYESVFGKPDDGDDEDYMGDDGFDGDFIGDIRGDIGGDFDGDAI